MEISEGNFKFEKLNDCSFEVHHVDGQALKHIRKSLQEKLSATAEGLKKDMNLETIQVSRLCGSILDIDLNSNMNSQAEQAPVVVNCWYEN